jgi:hypothetical protein
MRQVIERGDVPAEMLSDRELFAIIRSGSCKSPPTAISNSFRAMARKWRGSLPAQISIRNASANGFCRFKLPIGLPMFPVS